MRFESISFQELSKPQLDFNGKEQKVERYINRLFDENKVGSTNEIANKAYDINEHQKGAFSEYNADQYFQKVFDDKPLEGHSDFRTMTERERENIQEKTGMSDATLERCTINDSGTVKLSCINEDKIGQPSEVPYVRSLVDVNGIKIEVAEVKFPCKFEIQLPRELFKADDNTVFKYCTKRLQAAIEQDPELANQFTSQQLDQIKTGAPRISGLTWHHDLRCGIMQLVPTDQHSQYRHTGGKSIWGGGRT